MKTKVIFSTLLLLSYLMTSCDKNNQVNQEGSMESIFKINLISNPTTGYTWKWTNKQSITIVDSINHYFTPNYPDRVGSAGIETWKFRGKKIGTEVLEFKYNRSWDLNSTIDQKAITITVK